MSTHIFEHICDLTEMVSLLLERVIFTLLEVAAWPQAAKLWLPFFLHTVPNCADKRKLRTAGNDHATSCHVIT